MPKPSPATYPIYFQKYINLVPEDDIPTAFKKQHPVIISMLDSITEENAAYAYALGKWTIKELLQHIIDTERIFAFRSLCFARNEQASLPGFDENSYAENSHANLRLWKDLIEEFMVVRKSTECLFASFTIEALNNNGIANNNPSTANCMGFTAIGHVYHHFIILKERYL